MNENFLSVRLADTIMKRYPNPDTYPFKSWCYSQGFVLLGFCRLYQDTGNPIYRDYTTTCSRRRHHSPISW